MLIELSVSVTKKFVNFEYGLWVLKLVMKLLVLGFI